MAGHVPTPAQVKAAATVTGMIRSVQEHDHSFCRVLQRNPLPLSGIIML